MSDQMFGELQGEYTSVFYLSYRAPARIDKFNQFLDDIREAGGVIDSVTRERDGDAVYAIVVYSLPKGAKLSALDYQKTV